MDLGDEEKIFRTRQVSGIHLVWHYPGFQNEEGQMKRVFDGETPKRQMVCPKALGGLKRLKIR